MAQKKCRWCDGIGYNQDATDYSGANRVICGRCGGTGRINADECFPKGTKILTAKGDINIEEIKHGDRLISYNQNGNKSENLAIRLKEGSICNLSNISLVDGDILKATESHSVMTLSGWKRIDQLKLEDQLVRQGCVVGIENIKHNCSREQVFNIICSGDGSYVAEGILVNSFTNFRLLQKAYWNLYLFFTSIYKNANLKHSGIITKPDTL